MSAQTVVIDVFQTNKKLKEFDKNVDRLGKSLEKMQKQMERLNQEKRSTGLSQGDTLMKSLDKMTDTMTRIFSNGIKLNNPTVTAKVTVDFSKMNLAGQMGVALKNADIAGMIIRNLPRSRMTMPEMKIDMPESMKVEVTNEVKVKLPKSSPSDGKTPKSSENNNKNGEKQSLSQKIWSGGKGLKLGIESKWDNFLQKSNRNSTVASTIEGTKDKGLGIKEIGRIGKNSIHAIGSGIKHITQNPSIIGSGIKEAGKSSIHTIGLGIKEAGKIGKSSIHAIGVGIKNMGKIGKSSIYAIGVGIKDMGKVGKSSIHTIGSGIKHIAQNPSIIGSGIKEAGKSSIHAIGSGMKHAGSSVKESMGTLGGFVVNNIGNVAKLGIGAYTGAVGLFISSIKAATSVVKFMAGVFQKVAGVISAVWGQAQQWVFNPMVQTQNQISENKGYKMLLGGEDKAIEFDNSIFEMSEKSSFSHEALDSGARMFLSKGVSADETKRRLSLAQDTAAAFSLDDSGFQEITNGISQLSAKKNVYIEDVTQGFGNTIPTLKLITEGINKEAKGTKKSMDEIKDAIENGDYSGGELVEALLKGMETYGGTAEEIANTTFMGLKTKISNIFKSNVLKNWGKGLSDGFTTGFSKIGEFMDKHKGTFEKFGKTLEDLGKQVGITVTNVMQGLMERFDKVVNSEKFKSVDLSGKIVLLWDEIIKKPLADWWNSTGRDFMHKLFSGAGDGIGEVLTGVICGLMGSSPGSVVTESMSLGLELGGGIVKGLDGAAIFQGLVGVVTNIAVAPFQSLTKLWDDFCQHVKKSQEGDDYSPALAKYKVKGEENIKQVYFGGKDIEETDYKNGEDIEDLSQSDKVAYEKVATDLQSKMKPLAEKSQEYAKLVQDQNALVGFYNDAEKIVNMKNGEEKTVAKKELEERMRNSGIGGLEKFQVKGKKSDLEFLQKQIELTENKADPIKNELEQELNDEGFKMMLSAAIGDAGVAKKLNDWKQNRNADFQSKKGSLLGMVDIIEEELGYTNNTSLSEKEQKEHQDKMDVVMVLFNSMMKRLNVGEEELSNTGGSPERLRELVESKSTQYGVEAEEAQNFYNMFSTGIQSYIDVMQTLGEGKVSLKAGQDVNGMLQDPKVIEALKNGGTIESTGIHEVTNVKDDILAMLQTVDLVNQKTEAFAKEVLHKQIIIDVTYNNTGLPSVYTDGTNTRGAVVAGTALGVAKTALELTGNKPKKENADNNAKGNILMSPRLSWVAEAGPEAIIPLTGPYKKRGIGLWEQAGQMLGVTPKYGKGGIVGSYELPKETPRLYQQIEETEAAKETETRMSMPPQIQTGDMNFNFTFHGTDTNSQEEIMKVIKAQMPDIADEIAGTIAVNIQRIFANMQLQTG